jgi:hypothetical protein
MLVTRASFRLQVSSVLVKCITAALLVQPFLHVSSGRYWPALAPMLGIGAALLAHVLLVRRSAPAAGPEAPMPALTWVQAVVAGVILIASAVVVVGG